MYNWQTSQMLTLMRTYKQGLGTRMVGLEDGFTNGNVFFLSTSVFCVTALPCSKFVSEEILNFVGAAERSYRSE